MSNDRSPLGLDERFVGLCVSIFVGALALNWAAQLLAEIWLPLLIGGTAIALVVIAVFVHRWHRDRW